MIRAFGFCFLLIGAGMAFGQDVSSLLADSAVTGAMQRVEANEPEMLAEQARVCEIAAPPFHEEKRGLALQKLFEAEGLREVRIDKAGNVVGVRPGAKARPNLVFAAHLDTVFPEGTNVAVSHEGAVMKGPGIGDDCRGLVVMLGVIRALREARVTTPGTITFVADVGEEGLGDLRGMKELFGETLKGKIDNFISVDGLGTGITNVGVGSYRYKVTFKGPGGHSYGAFGMANPIQAMGRAIAKIDAFEVPKEPKTTFNVGRVGGGTSVNAIPFEAWMEVDMRSADVRSLETLNGQFKAAMNEAVEEENKRWGGKGAVNVAPELVGLRPAGRTAEGSAIVKTALAADQALHLETKLGEGSTDSNVPMNLGIPAITIGGGGKGSGAHSLNETYESTGSVLGTQRALLLALALAR